MIELRDAQYSDYLAISRLHAESWKQNYRGILSDTFLDQEVDKERLDAWHRKLKFPKENQHVTVATVEDRIAGFSCIYFDDSPIFGSLLDNLHVSLHFQKKGIGKLLMKECARQARQKSNSDKMYLWVFEANVYARKFYQQLGGVCYETLEKRDIGETTSRVCRYVWNHMTSMVSENAIC